eukprot:9768977-Prorocentrum_lima.AAC.1
MTSSLVGSEMCIRDRKRAFCDGGKIGAASQPSQPASQPAGHQKAPTAPVSYTHLTLPTICSV